MIGTTLTQALEDSEREVVFTLELRVPISADLEEIHDALTEQGEYTVKSIRWENAAQKEK